MYIFINFDVTFCNIIFFTILKSSSDRYKILILIPISINGFKMAIQYCDNHLINII